MICDNCGRTGDKLEFAGYDPVLCVPCYLAAVDQARHEKWSHQAELQKRLDEINDEISMLEGEKVEIRRKMKERAEDSRLPLFALGKAGKNE